MFLEKLFIRKYMRRW